MAMSIYATPLKIFNSYFHLRQKKTLRWVGYSSYETSLPVADSSRYERNQAALIQATCSSLPDSANRCEALGMILSSFTQCNFPRACTFQLMTASSKPPTSSNVGHLT